MKNLAVFTIARNESFFLPRWVRHYGRLAADLHVLDHESDDGSTMADGFVRHPVERKHTDDVGWMLRTVEAFFKELLINYRRVIFAEVDEFLVPNATYNGNLGEYLACHETATPITATGYDVCWQDGDPAFDPERPITSQRKWKRSERYDKTLISGVPMAWEVGFHRPLAGRIRPDADLDLLLIHLHYFDREIAWDRLVKRMAGREPHPGSWGRENKVRDRNAFNLLFGQMCDGAEPIPEQWRGIL